MSALRFGWHGSSPIALEPVPNRDTGANRKLLQRNSKSALRSSMRRLELGRLPSAHPPAALRWSGFLHCSQLPAQCTFAATCRVSDLFFKKLCYRRRAIVCATGCTISGSPTPRVGGACRGYRLVAAPASVEEPYTLDLFDVCTQEWLRGS